MGQLWKPLRVRWHSHMHTQKNGSVHFFMTTLLVEHGGVVQGPQASKTKGVASF